MDHLAPSMCPLEEEIPSFSPPISSHHSLDLPFTINELKFVLMDITDSAPGPDGIPYTFLKHAPPSALNNYLDLLNKFYHLE